MRIHGVSFAGGPSAIKKNNWQIYSAIGWIFVILKRVHGGVCSICEGSRGSSRFVTASPIPAILMLILFEKLDCVADVV